MKEKFLLDIYNQTINTVLDNIPENEHPIISKAYQEYLLRVYDKVTINEENINKSEEIFLPMEVSKWNNKTPDQKRAKLVKDEYYDKLFYISDLAFKEAQIRAQDETKRSNLTKEEVMEYLNKMEEYLTKVASYNKKVAKDYLSEASLDFMYAIGESDYKSFRISH